MFSILHNKCQYVLLVRLISFKISVITYLLFYFNLFIYYILICFCHLKFEVLLTVPDLNGAVSRRQNLTSTNPQILAYKDITY